MTHFQRIQARKTRKSLAFMPEWSHVETFVTSTAPTFDLGAKLQNAVKIGAQTIPKFARIRRSAHNKEGE